jgi:hypothetical protein
MTPRPNLRNRIVSIRAEMLMLFIGTSFFFNAFASQTTVKESTKTHDNVLNARTPRRSIPALLSYNLFWDETVTLPPLSH